MHEPKIEADGADVVFPHGIQRLCAAKGPPCNSLIEAARPAARCPMCLVVEAYQVAMRRAGEA